MNAVPGSGRLRADFSGRVVLVTGAAQGSARRSHADSRNPTRSSRSPT